MGSNPGTVPILDGHFSHKFVVKIVMFVRKDPKNKLELCLLLFVKMIAVVKYFLN